MNERSSGVTAERIHDAALTLFNERGYTGTTVRELADACDLTPGAIYNHYASKEALLFAIVDRVHDLADAVLSETLRSVGNDPRDPARGAGVGVHGLSHRPPARDAHRQPRLHLPAGRPARQRRAPPPPRPRAVRRRPARGRARGAFSFGELGSDDAIQAASMAILNMVVLVAEWFDPAGARSAQDTAALHGRLALRIARGAGAPAG